MKFDPLTDYFQVLGVSEDADLETIKKAYRLLALKFHPDRGGSHQAMLEINEAFEILAHPETRQRYEQARADLVNQSARIAIQADIAQARQKAEEYPRNWNDFNSWFERDFANANYGKAGMLPTVSNSLSGVVFWIVGGIAGFVIVGCLFQSCDIDPKGQSKLGLFGICGVIAFAMWLHKEIGKSMRKPGMPPAWSGEASSGESEWKILRCPQCGQQLRVSHLGQRIRCPVCKNEFNLDR